ncbi:fatty-acyl-CoA synthase [Neobacillus niacini]|uniref:class I adenylate-forming enzyme family protein n=1 Tax=Neobacillus niacini TaxID=86668 RepID=UPI002863B8F4|nr:AMP-binding protein [Neobacillus niacini]MDR7076065.1 fatty-acyl-CoA synthase [Neobacillus niacini]
MTMPLSKTLGSLLDENVLKYKDNEAMIFQGKKWTYHQLKQEVDQFAKGLVHLGVRRNDKVAILIQNRPEWIISVLACFKIGAVAIPLNTWYKPSDIEYVLKKADVKVLIFSQKFLNYDYANYVHEVIPYTQYTLNEVTHSEYPHLKRLISLGDKKLEGTTDYNDVFQLGSSIQDDMYNEITSLVEPDGLAYILFTSGSTARPKGVQVHHVGLIENGFNTGERLKINCNDKLWLAIPIFFGLSAENALMAVWTHGASVVIQEYFDEEVALKLFEEEKCTVYYGRFNMFNRLIHHPNFDKNKIYFQKGSASGTPEQFKKVAELIPSICNIYGATESYGYSSMTESTDELEIKMNCHGKPNPGFEFRVADMDTGEILPPGREGELQIKGYITSGYYNDPENTAKAFTEDGFYRSGDRGYLDEIGRWHFIGRIKDFIKTGGIMVSPRAVEEYIIKHPKVAEVNVTGFPDAVKDEVVVAVIETKSGERLTEEEVIAYCKAGLPSYSVPIKIFFMKEADLPHTATGKVPKNQLKELLVTLTSQCEVGS